MLAGPHPRSLSLRRSKTRYPREGAAAFQCSRGPTPARSRSGARRLAILARAQPPFNARGAPPPLALAPALEDSLSSRGSQALDVAAVHTSTGRTPGLTRRVVPAAFAV